jgi:MFS family permease
MRPAIKYPKFLNSSLSACVKEGVVAHIMTGIFDYYLIPLAIFLKASTMEIGLLVSIPALLSSLCQIFAVRSVDVMGSRKKLLTKGTLIQAVLLLPIPFLVFVPQSSSIVLLIVFVTIFKVIGSIMGPAWGSIVSDYLPNNLRGKFFGRRAQIISIAGVLGMGFCGLFLSWTNKFSESTGLFIIFLLAAVFRFMSSYYMTKLSELPHVTHSSDRFTFRKFIRQIRSSNFVRFVMYVSFITFATQLSSAYTSVYMLNELNFNYMEYMSVSLASVLMGLISFPIWGKHADMIGNAKILKFTSVLIPIIPLLWMVAKSPLHLVMVEAIGGFIWGGFNLCATNFIYDAVTPGKRVQCLCYFNLINGVALFAGASLGGYLATHLPPIGGTPLLTLFLLSGICRLVVHFIFAPHFREVRKTYHKVKSARLFISVLGVRSLLGGNTEEPAFPILKRMKFSNRLRKIFHF